MSIQGLKAQTVTFTPTNVTCNGAADATMKIEISGGISNYWYVCLNIPFPAQSDSIGPTTLAEYTFTNLNPGQLYLFYVRDDVSGDYVAAQTYIFTEPAVLNATVINQCELVLPPWSPGGGSATGRRFVSHTRSQCSCHKDPNCVDNPARTANAAPPPITCFGRNNGTIVISSPVGGSGSHGTAVTAHHQASGTFINLAPGTYNVVMRDAPGCPR
jgi:hypothetical protein